MSLSHSPITKIRVGCPAHNCGGRCLLIAHIEDGKIIRLDADDRPDTIAAPQLRACARGRAYLRRQYHPDRLMYPLKRVGKRGEGKFDRISWEEALDTVAAQFERVKKQYGNHAILIPSGSGSHQLNGPYVARRLLNCYGGFTNVYNSYSWGATNLATPTVYGTLVTGNQRQDWLNSKYIIMWGWNPAEMRDGTNSDYFMKLARDAEGRGAHVVCIDPRYSPSAAALADEWIPIRPGTDAAMMSAMAYVMLTENLYDAEFVRTHCVGFDASQMPVEGAESYSDYILGVRDGQPKTPEWAEAITAVPAATITRIAREYATTKPAVLYQGYGMQRRAYGEQVVRAGCVLAAISGNVGIPGGWASGLGLQADDGGALWGFFPIGENPVKATVPVFLWTEACIRGKELTQADGIIGAPRMDGDIKLIYAVASNSIINQHANINRTAEILRDESKVEFIVVQDNFLTPTGRFADIVLPVCTQFETWGVEDGWKYGDEVIVQTKLVEPPGECKSDYRICSELAQRLGIYDVYTKGRDEKGWVDWCLDEYRRRRDFPDLPTLDEFIEKNLGAYSKPVTQPKIAFADFRADPEKYPLNTPSGKIEIFSKKLYDLNNLEEIPAVPKYIQEWESPFPSRHCEGDSPKQSPSYGGLLRREERPPRNDGKYPLQAIGHHTLARVHSTHANNDWLQEAFPQRISINPIDAQARDIHDGDLVRVWNDRGELVVQARVTPRIMPGVVDIPQGAWWTPDTNGLDRGGCTNTLTSHRWTPFAFATAQHTIMVEVEKTADDRPQTMLHGLSSIVHRRGSQ
ncbi:anaerobic dimethyl sulfoxide reductase subunit A [Anaerolineales bacterium]|nr:anaerobic dimethyl sulfoxide reductase subunit A [Anaerolineales bacterium]